MEKLSENKNRFSYTDGFRKINLQDSGAWYRIKSALWYNPMRWEKKNASEIIKRVLIVEKSFETMAARFFPLTIGTQHLEAGYVFAPYIPMQLEPTIVDMNDFTPRRDIMTRYARREVNGRFYGVIEVDNIGAHAPRENLRNE